MSAVTMPKGGHIMRFAITLPLYALYGAWWLLVTVVGLVRSLAFARRLLKSTLRCTACGHDNALDARWICASCSAEYLGFVALCPCCRGKASFFPCERCRVALLLEPPR